MYVCMYVCFLSLFSYYPLEPYCQIISECSSKNLTPKVSMLLVLLYLVYVCMYVCMKSFCAISKICMC